MSARTRRAPVEAPAAEPWPGLAIERHDVDDPDAWRRLVAILADLIAEPTPDQPRRR